MNAHIRTADIALQIIESSSPPKVEDSAQDWPQPQPLPDELPPVMPFDLDLLPMSLRPWIQDIAERLQCPPDFPAVAAMIALATVVGRKIGIRPKRQDDWLVVPNLWGVAIGPPGVAKTPALREPLKPLEQLEIVAKEEFQKAMTEYEAQALVAEQRKALAKSDIKSKLRKAPDAAVQIARDAINAEVEKPTRRRYVLNDTTVEKIGEILNENPNGVLCYRDELVGLLKSLDKEGQEGARSFYLEAWNGLGRFTYDRIGRGTVDIESAIVSIIGSIQPGPLRQYLRGAVNGGAGADGLVQRFQLAIYPDIAKGWCNVDRWPDSDAKRRAYKIIYSLDRLNPADVGATQESNDVPFLRFDRDAQHRFDEWRSILEHRLRSDEEHAVVIEHLAKYRSLIPSLALLCHLAEGRGGVIGVEEVERAIAWGKYLESHAQRIYAVAVAPDMSEATLLAKKIRGGKLPDRFSLRHVYRKNWIGLTKRDAAERAVKVLVDLDWLERRDESTSGHPKACYAINPRLTRQTATQSASMNGETDE